VSGSLQQKSGNSVLLELAKANAPEGIEVRIFDGLRLLPHFDPDIEAAGAAPSAVTAWRAAIAESDALLLASPEYGHSLPGALKNAIDWVIGSGELESKVVAVTAAVPIAERGRLGLKALCDTLGAVSAQLVGGEPIVRGLDFERGVRELMRKLAAAVTSARLLQSSLR
jgi:NAD(P)H-dependent FMN reductase